MHRRISTHISTAFVILALAACGGGGTTPNPNPPPPPPPPPPPAPVATVTVTPNSANLVPQQTQPLTAATLDGAGSPLSGRAVAWATSAGTVATVSSSGLVTAVGTGTATITATSETKTGTAAITVADGGQVTSAGGTVDAAGGAVHIAVPAGAVAAPLSITVTPSVNPPAPPAGTYPVDGTSLTFGPEGTTFTTPVTVTMKYDPAKLPSWVLPGDLALYHFTGGAWVPYTNIAVDPVAHTITGQTTGFSPQLAALILPPAVLNPAPGSVNFLIRSVTFTAGLVAHPLATGLSYVWDNSANNGVLGAQSGNTIQYTMTQPTLPLGDLDQVSVTVSSALIPGLPPIPSAFATTAVNSNLTLSYQLNPDLTTVAFGQTRNLDAVVRSPDNSVYTPPATAGQIKYNWTTTTFHGDLDLAGQNAILTSRGVYTAKTAKQSVLSPPRIDKVTVTFLVPTIENIVNVFGRIVGQKIVLVQGSADAFVEVAPKTYIGQLLVLTTSSGGGQCVVAVAKVPKVAGATSYDLTVTGIAAGSVNSPTFHKVFSGASGSGLLAIYDGGTFYGVPMDGGCATTQQAITARQNLYQSQYGSADFAVTKSP